MNPESTTTQTRGRGRPRILTDDQVRERRLLTQQRIREERRARLEQWRTQTSPEQRRLITELSRKALSDDESMRMINHLLAYIDAQR